VWVTFRQENCRRCIFFSSGLSFLADTNAVQAQSTEDIRTGLDSSDPKKRALPDEGADLEASPHACSSDLHPPSTATATSGGEERLFRPPRCWLLAVWLFYSKNARHPREEQPTSTRAGPHSLALSH
jgi:hypothetical protein